MRSLPIIRGELISIRGRLLKCPVFLKGSGSSVTSPSAPKNEAELEDIVIRLKSLLRDLAAQENLARIQKWHTPPQSVSRWAQLQKEKEAREVLEETLVLRDLAQELQAKNGALGSMDTAGGLIKLAGQVDTEVSGILNAHQQIPDRPEYVPGQTPAHPLGADSATAALAWVILIVQWMKQKRATQVRD